MILISSWLTKTYKNQTMRLCQSKCGIIFNVFRVLIYHFIYRYDVDFKQFFAIGKLGEETRRMQMRFSDLIESLIMVLKHKKCSPKDLVKALDAYLPDECHQASDLDDFFADLLPHMSFFNYEIPRLIIQHLEGDLDKEVAEYEGHFELYCKNRVSGPHPVVFTNEAQNAAKIMEKFFVKLDVEWDRMPIEDMKRFQCKLGSILNIRQEKLQLQSVQKGCVLFTFLIHRSVHLMLINNGLTDDQAHELRETRVLSIEAESDIVLFENDELVCSTKSPCILLSIFLYIHIFSFYCDIAVKEILNH